MHERNSKKRKREIEEGKEVKKEDMQNDEIHIFKENVDIRAFPPEGGEKILPGMVLKIGDLHGNALKLMWILIYHGIVKMDPAEYKELADIYYNNTFHSKIPLEIAEAYTLQYEIERLRKEKKATPDIEKQYKEKIDQYKVVVDKFLSVQKSQKESTGTCEFEEYLDKLERYACIVEKAMNTIKPEEVGKILSFGDVLGDRGQQEIYTILEMGALIEKGLFDESEGGDILASNHDNAHFMLTRKGESYFKLGDSQQRSLNNYIKLMHASAFDILGFEELVEKCKKIIEEKYIPHLKLFRYEFSEEDGKKVLTLGSHAPNLWFYNLYEAAWLYLESDKAISLGSSGITKERYKVLHDQYILDLHKKLHSGDNQERIKMLCKLVDDVNAAFRKNPVITKEHPYLEKKEHPLTPVIWGRGIELEKHKSFTPNIFFAGLPKEFAGYNVRYEHGHDMMIDLSKADWISKKNPFSMQTASSDSHMRSFDNRLGHGDIVAGKNDGSNPVYGIYTAVIKRVLPALQLQLKSKDQKTAITSSPVNIEDIKPSVIVEDKKVEIPLPSVSIEKVQVPLSPAVPVEIKKAEMFDPETWIKEITKELNGLTSKSKDVFMFLERFEAVYKENKDLNEFVDLCINYLRYSILTDEFATGQSRRKMMIEGEGPKTFSSVLQNRVKELEELKSKLEQAKNKPSSL